MPLATSPALRLLSSLATCQPLADSIRRGASLHAPRVVGAALPESPWLKTKIFLSYYITASHLRFLKLVTQLDLHLLVTSKVWKHRKLCLSKVTLHSVLPMSSREAMLETRALSGLLCGQRSLGHVLENKMPCVYRMAINIEDLEERVFSLKID